MSLQLAGLNLDLSRSDLISGARHFAWLTSRRIKPGMMEEFKNAWQTAPVAASVDPFSGNRVTFFMQDERDPNRMIGLSIWASREAFENFRKSFAEADRRYDMEPYVQEIEDERFFYVDDFSSLPIGLTQAQSGDAA
jgi:heme-degrading monooxygenase HmoA